MKLRTNLFSIILLGSFLSLAPSFPSRADETNPTKETLSPPPPQPKRELFFFRGGRPLDFILALDRHFRTRLGEILSIPSSLARAEVPRIRLSTEDPAEVLK